VEDCGVTEALSIPPSIADEIGAAAQAYFTAEDFAPLEQQARKLLAPLAPAADIRCGVFPSPANLVGEQIRLGVFRDAELVAGLFVARQDEAA
jgi:hypothetical protein